jgi:hypothetical protein
VTQTALITFGRCYSDALVSGPVKGSGTLYAREGLRWLPRESDVPLVVDHDKSQEVGRVSSISVIDWMGEKWWAALATVAERPSWLKRGTGASFEYLPLHKMGLNGWEFVRSAIVREVTVTSPSYEARDPGAKVLSIGAVPATARHASRHWPAGTIVRTLADGSEEITHSHGAPVISRPGGRILAVR